MLNVGDVSMEVIHEYPDITVHITLFNATIADGVLQKLEHNEIKWITPSGISNYDFCPADEEILKNHIKFAKIKIAKMEINMDAGISSLRGFLYQIKVFILNVINNVSVCDVTYEGMDDIECSNDKDKLFYHNIESLTKPILIQVKNGNINKSVIAKVVLNWLKNGLIDNAVYALFYSHSYEFESKDIMVDDIIKKLKKANEKEEKPRADSTYRTVYLKYIESDGNLNEKKLKNDLGVIVQSFLENKKLLSETDVEKAIVGSYSTIYCKDINSNEAKERRVVKLIEMIQAELFANVKNGKNYKITQADFIKIHNNIVGQIQDNLYQPDWLSFRKKTTTQEIIDGIFKANEREVKQLSLIGMSQLEILNYLSYEIFYRDIREVYDSFGDNQMDMIESIAYDVYNDAKSSFNGEPSELFNKVVKSESYISYKNVKLDRFSNKGCYVHLTSDKSSDDFKITWVDDNE